MFTIRWVRGVTQVVETTPAQLGVDDPPVQIGPFALWTAEFTLRVDHRVVPLTRREFQVLHVLCVGAGHVVARDRIHQHVWGGPVPGHHDRSVDVHIRKLRDKLKAAAPQWHCIHTHHGVGYRFEPERLTQSGAAAPRRSA